ncbi:MAG: PSD1 domain-containing protein [Planctomycetes bacterium]|nr:PSD1 domain-containing protein [Planctomycetota bacterium]
MLLIPRLMAPIALAVAVAAPAAGAGQAAARADATAVEFFEKKVRPLLAGYCYNCHSANNNSQGGLRVDDRNGLLQGGNGGPAVVPGHPEKSLLIRSVRSTDENLKMPPKVRLSPEQVADLTKWIKDGAAWPEVRVPQGFGKYSAKYDKLRKEHWAWQPLREGKVPPVRDASWPRTSIDRFILAGLEREGLRPVSDADRTTLIRRVTFDLTGLPPTPAEIDAFLDERSTDAYPKLVERLLASPAFGERWGRHWLDVARYGESTGSARNVPYPQSWRYRDCVINALNSDKPYDRFLIEQIAGDLLPAETPRQRDEQRVATGFLALGVKDVNQRFKVRFVMDNIDEQIDTVTRSVLALTASCARCHNHKFDPIPQQDYYALAGIFHSTDLCAGVRNKMGGSGLDYYDNTMLLQVGDAPSRPNPEATEKIARAKKAFEAAKAEFEAIRGKPEGRALAANGQPKQQIARQKMVRLQTELAALTDQAASGRSALGVRDARTIGDTALRIRGEAEKLGPIVPRGFLSVLSVADVPKINPHQSGRLELARWLTSTQNPLTPRVMVNRVWHHLFGAGLVRSVDNFGVTGEVPSHPNLLDHLARQFVRDGWSVKKLVRAVVLSRAYQLGSDVPEANTKRDPANRLVWRHSPRRLSAEEIRDAALAAAGTLDRTRPVGSPVKDLRVMELADNGPQAKKLAEQARASRHRSVYLPLLRGLVPTSLEVFDAVEQGMATGNRDATTVAPQALYLLNDPFVWQQSLALAERLFKRKDLDDTGRIEAAYCLTLGRSATPKEVERVKAYLAEYELAARAEADLKTTPWASFCQALLGCAEFRYLK